MARVLVLYATTEGQTRKIAEFLGECIRERAHEAEIVDSTQLADDFSPAPYDGVVVAASIHRDHHQTAIAHAVKKHAAVLAQKPSAFLSVSLTAASDDPDDRREAQAYVDRFLRETGWQPERTLLVPGALRYTQYDFFKRWAMKLIARQRGAPTDTSRDVEYTDWAALSEFVDAFLADLARHAAAAASKGG